MKTAQILCKRTAKLCLAKAEEIVRRRDLRGDRYFEAASRLRRAAAKILAESKA